MGRLVGCLISWLLGWLTDCLVGWLIILVSYLVGWLVSKGWRVDWLVGKLVRPSTQTFTCLSIRSLSNSAFTSSNKLLLFPHAPIKHRQKKVSWQSGPPRDKLRPGA